jgi:Ca2+-binding RTX toxin-like protein
MAAFVLFIAAAQPAAAKGPRSDVEAKLHGRTLVVNGGAGDDAINLRLSATDRTQLAVEFPGNPSANAQFALSRFDTIEVSGGRGDDVITIDETNGSFTASKKTTLDGEEGDDTLVGGSGNERLVGGPGDDTLVAGGDGTKSSGGPGDDLLVSDSGRASLDGGAGTNLSVAAVVSSAANGVVTIFGDNADNTIVVSRNAAGQILSNGVVIPGASVANIFQIRVFGQGGNDTITLDEANGALPAASLFGAAGNDVLTGGSGADMLFGQAGNDTLLGKGGIDQLFGGADSDTLTGGDADDQAFGEAGNDRMVWNPGDDTDLNEGGNGTDTVEVNGGNGTETFTATANGTRVRFDRLVPAPFSIDIGTSENLAVNMNGGDDSFSASGNLASLIKLIVDGGTGNDTILGGNGNDTLRGSDGNDFIDGNQGTDTAFMGDGDDVFQWDPGDGSDIVEGQTGSDRMVFNGADIAEQVTVSANGGRVKFVRNVGTITMDLDDVESVSFNALGGADIVNVNDLSLTDLAVVNVNLAASGGAGDAAVDAVVVTATTADDVVLVDGDATAVAVSGLAAQVNITGAESANDRLTVSALAGDDVVDAQTVQAGAIKLTANGGDGDDVLRGGAGDDTLSGGAGDDTLLGGPGNDILDGGTGDNIVIQ